MVQALAPFTAIGQHTLANQQFICWVYENL